LTIDHSPLTIEHSPLTIEHSPLTIEHSEERSQWSMVNVQCSMIERSIAVKQRIVTEDPTEKGLRKALNLGHTVGHAIESIAMSGTADGRLKPILHGYAVAYGLVCELYLSVIKTGFPTDRMRQTVQFIREHYGRLPITCDDYPTLLQLMTHDKKNTAAEINFTLLGDIGDIRINQTATQKEIEEALDFYREG
jgi:3-dehydroquinate synthase